MQILSETVHQGKITDWKRYDVRHLLPPGGNTLGYCIVGYFPEHPVWSDRYARTSVLVSHDEATGEIETQNSRYTLVGPERATD